MLSCFTPTSERREIRDKIEKQNKGMEWEVTFFRREISTSQFCVVSCSSIYHVNV
jgi:hypothetical protein